MKIFCTKFYKILLLLLLLLLLVVYFLSFPKKVLLYMDPGTGEKVAFKEKIRTLYFYSNMIKSWNNDNGNVRIFYKNNKLALEGQLDGSGNKVGKWVRYDIKGDKIMESIYKNEILVYSYHKRPKVRSWGGERIIHKLISGKKYSVEVIEQNGEVRKWEYIDDSKKLKDYLEKEKIVYYEPSLLYNCLYNRRKYYDKNERLKKEQILYRGSYRWERKYFYDKDTENILFSFENKIIGEISKPINSLEGILCLYESKKNIEFKVYYDEVSHYIMVLYEGNDNFNKKKVNNILRRVIINGAEVVFSKI